MLGADLAAGNVERCEQGGGAMSLVVMGLAGERAPIGQLEIALRPLQRLDRRLLGSPRRPRARPEKKLAAFSALGGGFLRFPLDDRSASECARTPASAGNARASLDKRDSSGVAPASPQVADRALLERAGSREPADRGGVDVVGPGDICLRLAGNEALNSLLALVGRHLAGTTELHATGLRTGSAFARSGADQLTLELGQTAEHR